MASPLVSVIITCYNLGQYLDEAVDSVLAQTFEDLEILIVDDGSTDPHTTGLLSAYDRPRTRVLRTPNRGLPAARNLGLSHTSGPFVTMLDADDVFEPTLLEKSVAALSSDPSLAFVSHWFRTFGDESWEWSPTACDFPVLLDHNTVNGSALVRRSVLMAIGGFDEAMRDGCEDWDLWIRLVAAGHRGIILPEVLFKYRRRADSMSRTMMQADGYSRRLEYLATKHRDLYREHCAPLLIQRESDIARFRRHIHDLRIGEHQHLKPELARWRDEVATLERKHETRRLQAATLQAATSRLGAELAEARVALQSAVQNTYALDAELNRYRAQVEELRASGSWRLTAPLRRIYKMLRAIAGRTA